MTDIPLDTTPLVPTRKRKDRVWRWRYGVPTTQRSIAAPPEVWEFCDRRAIARRLETGEKHDCSNLAAQILMEAFGLREKYLNGKTEGGQ